MSTLRYYSLILSKALMSAKVKLSPLTILVVGRGLLRFRLDVQAFSSQDCLFQASDTMKSPNDVPMIVSMHRQRRHSVYTCQTITLRPGSRVLDFVQSILLYFCSASESCIWMRYPCAQPDDKAWVESYVATFAVHAAAQS